MPRIEAANIEEHIRVQTTRILDAATKLFSENGYRKTDMGDIAEAIGLARNSLYRYFPNKDFILLACVRRDMQPFLAQFHELEQRVTDDRGRIDQWLELQIEIATSPCHATMKIIREISEASPELRKEIPELHEAASAVLTRAITAVLDDNARDVDLICSMIIGMAQAAAGHAIRRGRKQAVLKELKRNVASILQGSIEGAGKSVRRRKKYWSKANESR